MGLILIYRGGGVGISSHSKISTDHMSYESIGTADFNIEHKNEQHMTFYISQNFKQTSSFPLSTIPSNILSFLSKNRSVAFHNVPSNPTC